MKNYNYIKKIPKESKLKIINHYSIMYNIPFNVLLGVYLIETKNRKIVHRIIENLLVTFLGTLSLIFKINIKNYTIGQYQIGIGNMLKYNFSKDTRHAKYIKIRNFCEYKWLFKMMLFKNNIKFAAQLIHEFILESNDLNIERQIRYIGQKYNGYRKYGVQLDILVNEISKLNRG